MDDKHSYHFYNKNLQPYANRLRNEGIPIAIGTDMVGSELDVGAREGHKKRWKRLNTTAKLEVSQSCVSTYQNVGGAIR